MNGTFVGSFPGAALGSGIDMGKFALTIEEVGRGGRLSKSGVSPGMRIATTLSVEVAFW